MSVDVCDVVGKSKVISCVGAIKEQEKQIEARQQSSRQIDILGRRFLSNLRQTELARHTINLRVVSAIERICSSKDACAGIERSCDAGFGD